VTVNFIATVDGLRAELEAAAAAAEAARSAAAKAEADMEDLAGAFQVQYCPATGARAVESG
jgi:outer membrane murein-binding lipoprotein Lpp